MSGALDVLDANDQKLMDQMRADDAAAPPEPERVAPEPAATVAPAEPAAADPAEPAAEPQSTVPQSALHAERERRKAAEKQLREISEKYARVDERMNLLMQAAQAVPQTTAAPVPPPDPNQDPLGYVQHVNNELRGQIAQLSERVQKTEGLEKQVTQAQLEQAQMQELQMWGRSQEEEYARESAPDYLEAMTFLKNARAAQLQAMGISDPMQIQAAIAQDAAAVAQRARQNSMQLGQVFYDLAKAHGYAKKAAAVSPAPAAATGTPTPAERLATAQRGADMASSLGAAGAAPRGELTPTALEQMSDAEFAKVLANMNGSAMRQMFGE